MELKLACLGMCCKTHLCSSFTKALKYFPRRQGFRDEQLFIPLKKKPNICFFLRTLVFAFEITVKWKVCYFLA